MDDDDQKEEEAAATALPSEEQLNPDEREATARPSDAGDYWAEWNSFHTAQQLFADEVAKVDSEAWDTLNKKTLGMRTVAVQKWFNELLKSKLKQAENAAAKWNKLGCPDKDKQNV